MVLILLARIISSLKTACLANLLLSFCYCGAEGRFDFNFYKRQNNAHVFSPLIQVFISPCNETATADSGTSLDNEASVVAVLLSSCCKKKKRKSKVK